MICELHSCLWEYLSWLWENNKNSTLIQSVSWTYLGKVWAWLNMELESNTEIIIALEQNTFFSYCIGKNNSKRISNHDQNCKIQRESTGFQLFQGLSTGALEAWVKSYTITKSWEVPSYLFLLSQALSCTIVTLCAIHFTRFGWFREDQSKMIIINKESSVVWLQE